MSNWCELEPDAKPGSFADLCVSIAALPLESKRWRICCQLTRIVLASVIDAPIVIGASCIERVYQHLSSSQNELGGLLVGRPFSLPLTTSHGYQFVTIITDAVPSQVCRNSATSVLMAPEVWQRAWPYRCAGKMVLGWYHSHPGIGVFFSGTDRATQRAFFALPYSIGLVVDPVAQKERLFFGADSSEGTFRVVVGAEMLLDNLLVELPVSSYPAETGQSPHEVASSWLKQSDSTRM